MSIPCLSNQQFDYQQFLELQWISRGHFGETHLALQASSAKKCIIFTQARQKERFSNANSSSVLSQIASPGIRRSQCPLNLSDYFKNHQLHV